ncbi:hypothetical protein AVEN_236397-1 [Araneus ventricosus]|uniref:Uncharacterized protein n=1 Tax=Araneus ventricosus TaxID=182803 RepID=A0A4Y2I836_ARAVE|nr:hypothetical protein AVEN_236397-1 [Araneus ventricosus]
MQLNWIKAHVGFLGNEAAENLAKQATKEGTHLHLQAPKCHMKKCLGTSLSKNGNKNGIQATLGEQFLIFSLKTLEPKPHDQENPSSSLQAMVLFPANSTDSDFNIQIPVHAGKRETLSPSPLRNFLSHYIFLSFYKTKGRKYSTLVETLTIK